MDPAPIADRAFVPSCFDRAEKFVILSPIPVLGCMALGGAGFGLATAFGQPVVTVAAGTTAAVLKGVNVANIAFDVFVVLGSLFACGCYYHIMPEWSFEQNVEKQTKANVDASEIEEEVKKNVISYDKENDQVDKTLVLAYEKIELLKKALEENKSSNIKLSDEFKSTVDELNLLKVEFTKVEQALGDAKAVVVSMIDMSKRMKSNIKSSKVVFSLFQDNNQKLDTEIKNLKVEKLELSQLLNGYSKVVNEEHAQFNFLLKVYEDLNNTCIELKKSIAELSKMEDKMEADVKRDSENTTKFENLEKKLEDLNYKLSS